MTELLHYVRKLLRDIDEKTASSQQHVCDGMYGTLESYREEVGYLRGLKAARASVIEMLPIDERKEIASR